MRAENEVNTIKPFYRQTLSFELSASAFSFRLFDYLKENCNLYGG